MALPIYEDLDLFISRTKARDEIAIMCNIQMLYSSKNVTLESIGT